jgi:hypothetical protein
VANGQNSENKMLHLHLLFVSLTGKRTLIERKCLYLHRQNDMEERCRHRIRKAVRAWQDCVVSNENHPRPQARPHLAHPLSRPRPLSRPYELQDIEYSSCYTFQTLRLVLRLAGQTHQPANSWYLYY